MLALVPAWIALLLLQSGKMSLMIAAGAIGGATVAKLLSESVRRRHDADASGVAAATLLVGAFAAMSVATVVALGSGAFIFPQIVLAAVAIAWAVLLLRPSSAQPNRYAPPVVHPLVPAFAEGPRRARGLLTAIVLTVSGAGLGYAGGAWLEGMRRHHEAIERYLATEPQPVGANVPDPLEKAYRKQSGQ